MKKVFKLTQENKHPDRVLDSIKYDIRRYLKRERSKKLPKEAVFWDFDCSFGKNSDEAEIIKASDITNLLDKAKEEGWEEFYIEIISKPSLKAKKKEEPEEENEENEEKSEEE